MNAHKMLRVLTDLLTFPSCIAVGDPSNVHVGVGVSSDQIKEAS